MASFEGIPSAFLPQPSVRSPKLRLYESLLLWNQGVDQLVAILRRLEKLPFGDKRALQCTQAEIEELRAGVNADFVEELGEHERRDQGRFWKQRRAYEKTMEDPDDVYFEVEEREEQRRKEGPPARLRIVQQSAMAEEQKRIETEKQRKRQRSKKRTSLPTKDKNTARENNYA
jgi:hypothetical protein